MPFVSAGQLTRPAPTALPDDALGLVAENLRQSPYSAIAVVDRIAPGDGEGHFASHDVHVLGLIDERDLAPATLAVLANQPVRVMAVMPGQSASTPIPEPGVPHASAPLAPVPQNGASSNGISPNGHAPQNVSSRAPHNGANSLTQVKARDVMSKDFGVVPAAFSLQNTLLTLDRYNASALPVVDGEGRFRGLISRSDVVAALGAYVRPPVVGGMATPLGVWLTDGRLQAGAPPLGLFLSGLVLAACFAIAHLLMLLGLAAFNSEWAAMFNSGRLGAFAEGGSAFNFLVTAVQGLLFLILMRLTPMAGIHAAEHQTVWAIERGISLTPENVSQMPRAHPRCGTNLMALAGLITILLQHSPSFSSGYVLLTLLFTFFFWRSFGTFLQVAFTTRPPTRKQLEGGIRAGKTLIEKYQAQPHALPPLAQRLFNSGILLAGAGMILGQILFAFLLNWAVFWILGVNSGISFF